MNAVGILVLLLSAQAGASGLGSAMSESLIATMHRKFSPLEESLSP